MDIKKIVVALLLITIIFSIASVMITLGLNITEMPKQNPLDFFNTNNGNVQLVIEQPATGEVLE